MCAPDRDRAPESCGIGAMRESGDQDRSPLARGRYLEGA